MESSDQNPTPEGSTKEKSRLGLRIGLILAAVFVVVLLAVMALQSTQEAATLRTQLEELQSQSPEASAEEVRQLVEEVGRLIELPEGETPTVATVTDKSQLAEIPFFNKAEEGDKVLIYLNARKAMLYRPSGQKLVEVASLNIASNQGVNEEFTSRLILRNGTSTSGLTQLVQDDLNQVLPNADIVQRDNAANTNYERTLVVDLTGDNQDQAQQLARLFDAEVTALPAGESAPSGADLLLIVGQDVARRAAAQQEEGSASPAPSPTPTNTPQPAGDETEETDQ